MHPDPADPDPAVEHVIVAGRPVGPYQIPLARLVLKPALPYKPGYAVGGREIVPAAWKWAKRALIKGLSDLV